MRSIDKRKKENSRPVLNSTVIQATQRPGDLIPAFARELQRLDRSALKDVFRKWREVDMPMLIDSEIEFWAEQNPEEASELVMDLEDALNSVAPAGFYFGSHPGDGSDYGFWEYDEDFYESKNKTQNIITLPEDVTIKMGDKDIILEKGDRVQVAPNKKTEDSYGWEIRRGKEWDAYEDALEVFGAESLADQLAKAMGDQELKDNLKYIFRMNDYTFPSGGVWGAYEEAIEVFGAESILDQLAQAMSSDELGENLAFIFRMNDYDSPYLA